jgi:hypothetical protein
MNYKKGGFMIPITCDLCILKRGIKHKVIGIIKPPFL